MAISRILLPSFALLLIIGFCALFAASDSINNELEQLSTKILALESSISKRSDEHKCKDESIRQLEKIIEEKSGAISVLQIEIESFQKKDAVDVVEIVGTASARAAELEEQVAVLRMYIESQNRRKHGIQAEITAAEKKLPELNLKMENLQKINDEQKLRLKKTEYALHMAEDELMRARMVETMTKFKKLKELAVTQWQKHGKPWSNIFLERVTEKTAQAQKWWETHVETANNKWVPTIRQQGVIFVTNWKPYVQKVSTKTIELYELYKNALTTHAVKKQDLADRYVKEAKKLSKLFIDHVATIMEPHFEKVRVVLKPCTKRVVHAYGNFLKSVTTYHHQEAEKLSTLFVDHVATIMEPHFEKVRDVLKSYTELLVHAYGNFLKSITTYHHQVKAAIQEHLNKHDITKSLVTKELVCFLASGLLLALPVSFVCRLLIDIFCSKKTKEGNRHGHGHHGHHRHSVDILTSRG